MKIIAYGVTGFIIFWLVEIFSILIGNALGAGASDAGIVVSAIAILSAVLVICTRAIIDAIKSLKLKE
jgi:hypothetical protein